MIEKKGLVIGFITDGMVPIEWMQRLNEMSGGVPSGIFWKYAWYKGKGYRDIGGYARARDIVVKQARMHKAKWLFFLDSVPGYTPIMVKDSKTKEVDFMPIEEIVNFSENIMVDGNKGIEYAPFTKDLEVMDANDNWTKIKQVIRHKYKGNLKRINTKGGIIDISPNHAIFKKGKNNGPVDVNTLNVGEILCMPRMYIREKKLLFVGNEDLAWLLGFFCADGSTSSKDISFSNNEINLLERCKSILTKIFQSNSATWGMTQHKESKTYRIGCSNLKLVEWFTKECYTSKHQKKVPKSILNAPLHIKKAFLDGFHAGDGCHSAGDDYKSFTKDSQTLFAGIVYLLQANGHKNYNINIRDDKPKVIQLTVNKHNDKWQQKQKAEIKQIKDIAFDDWIYDISTESERFCGGVGNFLLHNTDVAPPPDAITRLMSHNKDIVTGIYYMKTSPAQPVIFKSMGDGPYWDYPVEDLFEIEGAGLGCSLIKMDVFDKFEEKGIPLFQENWIYTKPDGSKVKVRVGEDHYFFIKAKELGYKVWCDSSILCDHIDIATGAVFPGQEEVAKIREKILKKHGRSDIIDSEKKLFSTDSAKKTIVFYNTSAAEFAGDEHSRRGVGGAESCVIKIAKVLARVFNVIVICNCPRPGVYDGVKYLNVSETEFLNTIKTDLLVVVRNTKILADVDFKSFFKVDKVALWCHDLPESYVFDKLPRALNNIDRIFALTKWHKEAIQSKFPEIPEDKWFYAKNAANEEFKLVETIKRNKFKMIYSSTPFRGLDVLLDIFPRIKEQVPQAELHIFSSMKVYGHKVDEDQPYLTLYEKAKNMPGVTYHGTVNQKELAKHMKEARLLTYPSTYKETYCITAIEAMSAGTPVITSRLAALPEVIPKGCGVLIDGDANSEEYQKKYVDYVCDLLTNDIQWEKMHKECLKHDFSWESAALDWVKEFFPAEISQFSKHATNATDVTKTNINTPEYWDKQYKYEDEKGIQQRDDDVRWDLMIEQIPDNTVVLDYGCAKGEFLRYLKTKRSRCKLYGIDFSQYALMQAIEKDPTLRLATKIENLPADAQKGYFDVITSQHVIEHFDNPEKFITDLKNLLTKNGTLILAIPIEDAEWIEHQKIWKVSDVITLLDDMDADYQFVVRNKSIRKRDDGKFIKELVAFIKFKEVN